MAWKFATPAGAAAPAAATAAAPQPAAAASPMTPAAHPLPPPAAMPPMQPPAATAPPAAPAAEAPKRRRRSASEMAAAAAPAAQPAAPAAVAPQQAAPVAPVAAPAAQVLTPTVIQPNQQNTVALPPGGWLAMFVPQDLGRTAGAAVAAIADAKGGEPNIFPTIALTGGDTGGMFDYDEMNEEGSDDALPTGRKPFGAVLLTYRLLVLGWPRGATGAGGPKVRPKFQGVISANNGDAANIATEALKQYQFRSGRPAEKGGPEPFYDALCHPAIAIEALCFEPEAGIIAVRSTYTYDSLTFTNAQINDAFPKQALPDGRIVPVISPQPVMIEPLTWKTKGSKKRPEGWNEHGVTFKAATMPLSAEMQQVVAAFTAFYQQAGQNQELAEALAEWCKHTLTPQDLDILSQIANAPR